MEMTPEQTSSCPHCGAEPAEQKWNWKCGSYNFPDSLPFRQSTLCIEREAIEMGLVQGSGATTYPKGVCGKSVFPSETKCKEAIKHRLRAGFVGTSFLRAYFCDQCAGWHMSSSHTKHNK